MVEIKKLNESETKLLIELIDLYADVFEMKEFKKPSVEYLNSLLKRPGVTFLVAVIDKQVVGGLTAHDLPSVYFEANEVYVYDLAVAKKFQRQGIGKKLLSELKRICAEKGDVEFFLEAELVDKEAIEFYKSADGMPENVMHFSFGTIKK